MSAAEPATLALDATLLVSALLTGPALERETVVRAERDPTLGLGPVPTKQHPGTADFKLS